MRDVQLFVCVCVNSACDCNIHLKYFSHALMQSDWGIDSSIPIVTFEEAMERDVDIMVESGKVLFGC